jgi:hypothetical protein
MKIDGIPKGNNIKLPAREVQINFEESLDVITRLLSRFYWSNPFRTGRLFDEISHVNAMAKTSNVVDVGGRCRANIQDSERFLCLEVLLKLLPPTGMTWNSAGICSSRGSRTFTTAEEITHLFAASC